jgi:ATP-dependent protease ClpP protease subunit
VGLELKNAADNPVLSLYGVIGDEWGGVTADQFRQTLSEIDSKTPIELRIHSEGGSYFDGVAIHSQLKGRKGKVSVVVDGLAASAASLVAMAGTTIAMARHSWMMIHEARGGMYGTEKDFRDAAERLKVTNGQIVDIYSARWKGSKADLAKAVAAETWLTADDAMSFGLADSIDDAMAIAAHFDPQKFGFKNMPEAVICKPTRPLAESNAETLAKLFGIEAA